MTFTSINPWTGEQLAHIQAHNAEDIQQRLQQANLAYQHWAKHLPAFVRAEKMHQLAKVLRQQRQTLARLITAEMGKLYRESLAEVDKCAWLCDVYAEQGAKWLEPEVIATQARLSQVIPLPLGVILLIMPWNFPFWQVFRAAVPALVAGNVVLLKHASNVPQCALAIEQVFAQAGFDEGLFQTLMIGSHDIEPLIRHPMVRGVSLTGSEAAGRAVARIAGETLKKVVLELGGSDPFIVLEDADLDKAVDTAIRSRFINGGQSCIAAKRFIIDRHHYDDFVHAMHQRIAALNVGDPMDEATDIPPLARADLCETLDAQIKSTLGAGGRLLVGGQRIEGTPAGYRPTLIADVGPGMRAFDEETFGPLAIVSKANDLSHALSLANHSRYGLGSTVFTSNDATARLLSDSLETGSTFVNGLMRSDPRLPFGGVKDSGMGREMGRLGLLEFTNLKTFYLE